MDPFEKLDYVLDEIMGSGGSWQEKAEKVLAFSSGSSLGEFLGWFTVDDDGEVSVAK